MQTVREDGNEFNTYIYVQLGRENTLEKETIRSVAFIKEECKQAINI
jgi:hypothetical protein